MGTRRRAARRAGALVLSATVLAMGAVACGSDDDGSDADATASQVSEEEKTTGTPAEQIAATHADFTADSFGRDYAGACEVYSRAVIKTVGGKKRCELQLKANRLPEIPKEHWAKVTKVEVEGNKATVSIKSKIGFKPLVTTFVKEDGRWKLDEGFSRQPTLDRQQR